MTEQSNHEPIFYIPNKIGRILLLSYEEVIGQATEGASAEEFDELLQQLAEREQTVQGQQRLEQGTELLIGRIGEL